MDRTILQVHFPLGKLPANGWSCPVCGDEILTGRDAQDVEKLAKRLGLYGLRHETRRKVTRIGDSAGVTIGPDLLQDANIRIGDQVFVGTMGGAIVIRGAPDEEERAAPPRKEAPARRRR